MGKEREGVILIPFSECSWSTEGEGSCTPSSGCLCKALPLQTALAKLDRGDWPCLQTHSQLLRGALNLFDVQTTGFAAVPLPSCPDAAHPYVHVALSRLEAPCTIGLSRTMPMPSAEPCPLPLLPHLPLQTACISLTPPLGGVTHSSSLLPSRTTCRMRLSLLLAFPRQVLKEAKSQHFFHMLFYTPAVALSVSTKMDLQALHCQLLNVTLKRGRGILGVRDAGEIRKEEGVKEEGTPMHARERALAPRGSTEGVSSIGLCLCCTQGTGN